MLKFCKINVVLLLIIFLDGDTPRSLSYEVYIPQRIRFPRLSSHVKKFKKRNTVLTA